MEFTLFTTYEKHAVWVEVQCLCLLHLTIFTAVLCLLLMSLFVNAVLTPHIGSCIVSFVIKS